MLCKAPGRSYSGIGPGWIVSGCRCAAEHLRHSRRPTLNMETDFNDKIPFEAPSPGTPLTEFLSMLQPHVKHVWCEDQTDSDGDSC